LRLWGSVLLVPAAAVSAAAAVVEVAVAEVVAAAEVAEVAVAEAELEAEVCHSTVGLAYKTGIDSMELRDIDQAAERT
jgi:hypothetical protein